MAFFYFYRTDIQHGLFWRFLANKKGVMGIFVLFLLAMVVVPLCYSSNLIERHSDGHRVRGEINDRKKGVSIFTPDWVVTFRPVPTITDSRRMIGHSGCHGQWMNKG
ncbi:hypothetical protein [Endozoicomonas sp. 4G]|uniref:hypothetical protein n=1 Tax=Endozoicomonas sp. 4G TaxID=2872754 RepID=UPI002079194A|nr:hypothetical protein [Endozoicomonas sp. 4G]